MIKHNIANVIIHDLSKRHRVQDGFEVNSGLISEVVEGWDRKVYVVPNQAMKFNHLEPEKYLIM